MHEFCFVSPLPNYGLSPLLRPTFFRSPSAKGFWPLAWVCASRDLDMGTVFHRDIHTRMFVWCSSSLGLFGLWRGTAGSCNGSHVQYLALPQISTSFACVLAHFNYSVFHHREIPYNTEISTICDVWKLDWKYIFLIGRNKSWMLSGIIARNMTVFC